MMRLIAIIFLALPVLLAGCKKEKADRIPVTGSAEEVDFQRIYDCHDRENPYPSQINANIEGTWVWENLNCPQTQTSSQPDKYVVIDFNDGGLYKVFENSKLISEGDWSLESDGLEGWLIIASDPNEYIKGYAYICGNELVLTTAHLDGCNYYFKRDN